MNLFWFAADYRVQGRERSAVSQDETDKDLEVALDIFQVGQAAAGDRRAFDLLYRRWHPRLLRLARRLTGRADQAQDVLHGFKGIEIAAALGIPLGTVKSRLFKARADLKSIYMAKEGEENGL